MKPPMSTSRSYFAAMGSPDEFEAGIFRLLGRTYAWGTRRQRRPSRWAILPVCTKRVSIMHMLRFLPVVPIYLLRQFPRNNRQHLGLQIHRQVDCRPFPFCHAKVKAVDLL